VTWEREVHDCLGSIPDLHLVAAGSIWRCDACRRRWFCTTRTLKAVGPVEVRFEELHGLVAS
jgi:hypothetical protein